MENKRKDFKVDLDRIHLGRTPGISGMMRVKDDAEFIHASVESCIDALDELVIVYNGCTDGSPAIIESLAKEYPAKIRVFHYEPEVICGSLTKEQYELAKTLPDTSPELLASYYNYALAKTTRSHVLKIDADQIYFSDLLRQLCDRIRHASLLRISPADWISFIKLARKIRYLSWRPGDNTPTDFRRYRKVLEYLCAKGLLSIAMSGINIFMTPEGTYVPQGKRTGELNILGPFNGTADHLIFKVRKGTRFIPFDCSEYADLTSAKYTYIEKLVGEPRAFSWGLMWWHLNPMRRRLFEAQTRNLRNHPDAFVEISRFLDFEPKHILESENETFIPPLARVNYTFYWTHCKNEVPADALSRYTFDPKGYLTARPISQTPSGH